MKGVVLAGGNGTRLFPITKGVSKQLLCVYDKPMIYYPLSVLINSGINEILIISCSKYIDSYQRLFGNGKNLGLNFSYKIQEKPLGIAHALLLAESFISNDSVCLILGDNIFYGSELNKFIFNAQNNLKKFDKASIFAYHVMNPSSYGIIEFKNKKIISITEKPEFPKSNYAVTGIYFYPKKVCEIVKYLKPSKRGELEITDLNNYYLKANRLSVEFLKKGFTWLDTGTVDSLLEASNFIKTIEARQGLKIGCIEEIAYEKGLINKEQLIEIAENLSSSEYGKYLIKKIK